MSNMRLHNPVIGSEWLHRRTLKLTPHYTDSFKKRMDLRPNFHLHTGVTSSKALTASSTTVSTLGDIPTNYFGV